jgi:AP-1 complex subunit beta-1
VRSSRPLAVRPRSDVADLFSCAVTLVSSAPEVQWVALRNINLILQKRPEALSNEMRVFFCKYNDPPYVKVEKLEIMIKLVTEKNVDTFLSELKEYVLAQALRSRPGLNLSLMRTPWGLQVRFRGRRRLCPPFYPRDRSMRGQNRGSCGALRQCLARAHLDTHQLCGSRGYRSHQGQDPQLLPHPRKSDSLHSQQDIFRRYPQRYEGIIPTLCASLDELDEPEAKASLIWILGEYADKIENADELIGTFLDNYSDEPVQVQLQTLTAVVKLFLHRPEQAQALVQRVLALATKAADSADLRDRAYIQWRLLSSDTEIAKVRVMLWPSPRVEKN